MKTKTSKSAPVAAPKKMKRDRRMELLGWLATYIGGWNASAGSHPGRMIFDVDINDDEQVTQHLLNSHRKDVEVPLLREIVALKAKLYDRDREIEQLKAAAERDLRRLCTYQQGKMPAEFQYPTPENPQVDVTYSRTHDDHDGDWDGVISVTVDKMGDVWFSTDEKHYSLRFRTFGGGGMSQRTRNALLILAEAIRLDNEDRPEPKDKFSRTP